MLLGTLDNFSDHDKEIKFSTPISHFSDSKAHQAEVNQSKLNRWQMCQQIYYQLLE